jgi:acyl carrier protein
MIDLANRTMAIVADIVGVARSEVTLDTSTESVEGWDSLVVVNLLMAIEAEFSISLQPEDAEELVSVRRIVELLKSREVQ